MYSLDVDFRCYCFHWKLMMCVVKVSVETICFDVATLRVMVMRTMESLNFEHNFPKIEREIIFKFFITKKNIYKPRMKNSQTFGSCPSSSLSA